MKRWKSLFFAVALAMAAAFVPGVRGATPTHAATGDTLRTITVTPAPNCPSTVEVGVAFDGKELLVSCTDTTEVTRVDPATGANIDKYNIVGMALGDSGIGAMAWDADVGQLWIGSVQGAPWHIYSVLLDKTTSTGTATLRFSHAVSPDVPGAVILDGLAYDGTDKSLWLGPDVNNTVYHYDELGAPLGSFSVAGKIGSCSYGPCGKSGLAVADANTLYIGNDGGQQIYAVDKAFTTFTAFASTPTRVEDLECDNVDFAPKSAIWSKEAFNWELKAFEVPAGQCAQGGVTQVPTTVTLSPAAATNPVGTKHTVTATVLDQNGKPIAGVTVYFTVTGSDSATGSCVTDVNGKCSFTYQGPVLPGADAITGCAGMNGALPCGAATKVWVFPQSSPLCTIDITDGGWIIANNGDKSSFGGNVHTDQASAPSGQEQYTDKPVNLNVHSIDIKAVTCSTNLELADIYGTATINGSGSYDFRIEVTDPDSTNGNDMYWIILSNGYNSGNHPLGGGHIEIHHT